MLTSAPTPPLPAPGKFPLRRFASDARVATVFNVVTAIVITALTGRLEDFPSNLVFSMCIGTIAFVLIDGIRLKLCADSRRLKWALYLPVLLLCGAIAQFAGTWLACVLLGIPPPTLHSLVAGRGNMLVLTLIATAGITAFFVNRERALVAEASAAKETARAEEVQRQALQTQLQLLQAQIEPHMLFNTLANLQGLIALDPDRAQQMLDQLIQYLRATLSSSRAQNTTLAQEFALLQAYLGLMSVRMGERLSYAFDLPDQLRGIGIPPMLLQPLVENAIAHGLEPTIDGGHIRVSASRERDLLTLSVADDGRGPDAGPGKAGTSVGLSNTRARLAALFGERATVTLRPADGGGAIACITIPLSMTP
jgi:sensor histidine kinase YesM